MSCKILIGLTSLYQVLFFFLCCCFQSEPIVLSLLMQNEMVTHKKALSPGKARCLCSNFLPVLALFSEGPPLMVLVTSGTTRRRWFGKNVTDSQPHTFPSASFSSLIVNCCLGFGLSKGPLKSESLSAFICQVERSRGQNERGAQQNLTGTPWVLNCFFRKMRNLPEYISDKILRTVSR